jgi:hypothetical protein
MTPRNASRLLASVGSGLVCSASTALAADLTATIEIPQINTAEYHRPYIAIWIEGPDRAVAANVSVWYDVKMANKEGETWLKDVRQWWRKSGRELELPQDGLSGPTRPVGTHELKIPAALTAAFADGDYTLVVEASREVGGREVVRLPFQWSKTATIDATARGERELGTVTLRHSK